MGTDPQDLYILAQEFLTAAVEALDTIPTFAPGLGGAPARSFVSPGLPAFDCCDPGQLTVHVTGVTDSATGPSNFTGRSASTMKVNTVGLVATAVRCVPVITDSGILPSMADMEAAAEQIDADGWALWNHIYNLLRADQLFTLCGEVFWDGLRSINPQGGCGGFTLNLRVELSGYEETL